MAAMFQICCGKDKMSVSRRDAETETELLDALSSHQEET